MSCLLVTYDLVNPGQSYSDIANVIGRYSWARLSESAYAIQTNDAPANVMAQLKFKMDHNDKAYVIPMHSALAGYGPDDVNQWLQAKMGIMLGRRTNCLLVTYDLKQSGQKYAAIKAVLDSYSNIRLSESTYALRTPNAASTVFDRVSRFVDTNDQFYVIPLHGPSANGGLQATNQWLASVLSSPYRF